eukprot:7389008-Prymnesium_polylepis.1
MSLTDHYRRVEAVTMRCGAVRRHGQQACHAQREHSCRSAPWQLLWKQAHRFAKDGHGHSEVSLLLETAGAKPHHARYGRAKS